MNSYRAWLALRSTKAGARTPATPSSQTHRTRTVCTLNEGRGTHPGDTRDDDIDRAQPLALNEGRGTHPGDTIRQPQSASTCRLAQRRPGHAPRRHGLAPPATGIGVVRSTKAGARTPATRCRSLRRRQHLGRSTKAGARTPATHRRRLPASRRFRPAQRRPGHAPRRHDESSLRTNALRSPLNEGRGTHPGDTGVVHARKSVGAMSLNEGRGTHPGDTAATMATWAESAALNEGRGTHPGDTGRRG